MSHTEKLNSEIEAILRNKQKQNIPVDAIVMAVEEMLHNNKEFRLDKDTNQTISFKTNELFKYIQYFSYEQDEKELTDELIQFHNSSFNIFVDMVDGTLYSIDGFFEFSPYDNSQITLLSESIELVE